MVETLMGTARSAFQQYAELALQDRKNLLYAIADELEAQRATVVGQAMAETNLTEVRLNGELSRTIFQLKSYGDAAASGEWLDASIDTADPQRTPPKPKLHKTSVPVGPVLVFGASNFPFAYSTAGGDTASALAAGCVVIVKAHPAHVQTSVLVANAIGKALDKQGLPQGIFQHVTTDDRPTVNSIITHKHLKAIGFTGSFFGGKAIWELANSRPEPIPVFAEMSSINPVFIFPKKMEAESEQLANTLAASITLGAGQFCTNPGLIIVQNGAGVDHFLEILGQKTGATAPVNMLHQGIADHFNANRNLVLAQANVELVAENNDGQTLHDIPTIAKTTGKAFLQNPNLATEVFGSFSLVVVCENAAEMLDIATGMQGQLTSTLMVMEEEMNAHRALVQEIIAHCGRVVFNGVPTGVEVCKAMQHGGPWPSTTAAYSTSVGADAIKRFARPVSYQNFPNALLPLELQDENPLGIYRTVNNVLTKAPLA
jgi:2,5-dioxopentanoate dehydrogenase